MVLASSIYIYIRVYVDSHSLGQLALASKRTASYTYGGHVGFRFSVVDGSISLFYLRSLLLKIWE